jgi:hypothetical protein
MSLAKIKWESKEEELFKIQEAERLRLEKELLERELSKAPSKISSLEEENMSLMLAAAETYEQMYNENMTLMLAVAEMYEEMQALKGGTP